MLEDHAQVEREGFKVPLIGISPSAMLQECDACHEQKAVHEVMLMPDGRMLCEKCRSTNSAALKPAPSGSA